MGAVGIHREHVIDERVGDLVGIVAVALEHQPPAIG
jgi:hypothetical protein